MESLLCLSFILVSVAEAQNCLQAVSNGGDLPNFSDSGFSQPRITHMHQAIVASYQFHCCGNVTGWGADVERDSGMDQNQYNISFQVWRPSPVVEIDGCYSKVGENSFTSVTLDDGLVRETPSIYEQILFQPGDVVGFFVTSGRGDEHGVVLDTLFDSETVWYGRIDEPGHVTVVGGPNCPFPVGTQTNRFLQTSTSAAPVISVSYLSTDCPPLITTSALPPDQPSPTSAVMIQTSSRFLTITPTPTVAPALIGGGQLPRTVRPDQTQPSMVTPSSTMIEIVDETTSNSPPSVEQPTNNIGLIIGVIVGLTLVMVIIVLAIIAAGCIMRKKLSQKKPGSLGNIGPSQEVEDVEYDVVDDFQTTDVHNTGSGLVTHTNEAYSITSIGDIKMNENGAYGHTTHTTNVHSSAQQNGLELELDLTNSVPTSACMQDSKGQVGSNYNYIDDDNMVDNDAYISSTGGMKLNTNVAYGHTRNCDESQSMSGEDGAEIMESKGDTVSSKGTITRNDSDYNYVQSDAYISTTGGMRMDANVAYGHISEK